MTDGSRNDRWPRRQRALCAERALHGPGAGYPNAAPHDPDAYELAAAALHLAFLGALVRAREPLPLALRQRLERGAVVDPLDWKAGVAIHE